MINLQKILLILTLLVILMSFDRAFAFTVKEEGGYVNHPKDKGGETKFGISKRAYPHIDIKGLSIEQAKKIYYQDYWLASSADRLPERLALLHFDSAVNHGVGQAKLFLQAILCVKRDGRIGPITLGVLYKQLELGDESNLIEKYLRVRREYYYTIVSLRPDQKVFLKGWLNRLNKLKAELND